MIQDVYDRIKPKLPLAMQEPFKLGRLHMLTPGAFPRIVMAPGRETLRKGGAPSRGAAPDRVIADRELAVIFWVQHKTYAEAEQLVTDLLKAIQQADFHHMLDGASIEWHDEQQGQAQGVTAMVSMTAAGQFTEPATRATLTTLTPTPENV